MGIFRKIPTVGVRAWLLEKHPCNDADVVLHTVTTPPITVRRIDGDYFYEVAMSASTGKAVEAEHLIANYIFESN